jgi:hypothetical protein
MLVPAIEKLLHCHSARAAARVFSRSALEAPHPINGFVGDHAWTNAGLRHGVPK